MAVNLDDAREKLRWAKRHLEILRAQVEAFEQRDTHALSYKLDADEGEYTFHVHGLELTDPDWGLVIGDCLHNARTALDYLLVRLVASVSGEDPKGVKTVSFPISDEEPRFASKVGEIRKDPLLKHYLTRIEELQPFNMGNPAIWGFRTVGQSRLPVYSLVPVALRQLSALDNIDKHRVVHAVWVGGVAHFNDFPGVPADFRLISQSQGAFGPLEDGAQVGSLNFEIPLPHEWQPTQMDMKRHFPLQVSFAEPLPMGGVLEILPLCLWGVETVLNIFEPVFSQGQPPLPVTTALAAEEGLYTEVAQRLSRFGFGIPNHGTEP